MLESSLSFSEEGVPRKCDLWEVWGSNWYAEQGPTIGKQGEKSQPSVHDQHSLGIPPVLREFKVKLGSHLDAQGLETDEQSAWAQTDMAATQLLQSSSWGHTEGYPERNKSHNA